MTAAPSAPGDAAALDGIRVLDFTIMMAGPYCTRLMADVGAHVVKVEPPDGDDMRLRQPRRDGHSSYFGQLNAGKRSMTLDLKKPEAVALARRLAAESDVLVENFRPGVMARLGLDYGTLVADNPGLVYCSISGYGQDGPGAGRAAYAPLIHAASGFDMAAMDYAGDRDRPARGALFIADVLGGIFAFSAIQTALVQRARTGAGQAIDVALMDCMMNLLVYELQEAQFPTGEDRPTYGPVATVDGDIMIMPVTQRNFTALCDAVGRPDMKADDRFNTLPARNRNWHRMMDELEPWTRQRTTRDCIDHLQAAGVPCTPYNRPGDALRDPHLRARGTFASVRDAAGIFTGANAPFRMGGGRVALGDAVPGVGEQTRDILEKTYGLEPGYIDDLAAAGAFGAPAP